MPTWGWVLVCGAVGLTAFVVGRRGMPIIIRAQGRGQKAIDPVIDPKVAVAAKIVSKAAGSPQKV